VLAGALVTYGGVSLFVAFFVFAPMAHALFRSAGIRLWWLARAEAKARGKGEGYEAVAATDPSAPPP
jgi:H+/gluconate symporter-like permease